MDITTVYQKERQEFGRPVNTFTMSEVIVLDEFLPKKADYNHIERNPTILDIQAIPTSSQTEVRPAAPPTQPAAAAAYWQLLCPDSLLWPACESLPSRRSSGRRWGSKVLTTGSDETAGGAREH